MNNSGIEYLAEIDFAAIPAQETPAAQGSPSPFVSILMLAYNHESTVSQAIQGVLAQQCSFAYELIVGEDCSGDGTMEICKRLQRENPGKIRLVTAGTNVGMHKNFARIWHRARGKYLAMCEGDDYWTDDRKLQKQVALLEENPEYAMCASYTRKIRQGKDKSWRDDGIVGPARIKERYTVADLIPAYNFHFSSILVRKEGIRFPRWFWEVYCVDRPLYLLCAEQGPVGFIPEVTSVYRLHEGGAWSPVSQVQKAEKGIRLFGKIDAYFSFRYAPLIRRTLGDIIWSYMAEAMANDDLVNARRLFWKSMGYAMSSFSFSRTSNYFAVFLRLYMRKTYDLLCRCR